MLSTTRRNETVCHRASSTTTSIFDAVVLWDIIFDYVGNTFFYSLLPSLHKNVMPEMVPYAIHRGEKDKAMLQNFVGLAQIEDKIKEVEAKAASKLKEKIKALEAAHQLRLNDEIKALQEKSSHELEHRKQEINTEADEKKKALLSGNNIPIMMELILMMDQFISLESKEELSLGPWWRRIQRRTDDQASIMGMVFLLTFIPTFFLTSMLILLAPAALIVTLTSGMFFLIQVGPGLILGTLVAILFGLFEIGEAEKSKNDALSSFSPGLVGQFEQIKTVQTNLIDAKHEHSFAHINTASSLTNVTSAVKNCHAFFTQLVRSKEEQARKEEKQSSIELNCRIEKV